MIARLFNKNKYVLRSRNLLQLYLELGVKLTKIHRMLQVNESPWLAKYIAFNTAMRSKAKHDFRKKKDFYKFSNNAILGKTNGKFEKENKY